MWSGCVTCGRPPNRHLDWCGWVNDAMTEARDGGTPEDWWPWWLESTKHSYYFTSENAREMSLRGWEKGRRG